MRRSWMNGVLGPFFSGRLAFCRFEDAPEGVEPEGGSATPTVAPETPPAEPEAPWYDKYHLAEDETKRLAKYTSEEDAIRSIPHRDKLVGDKTEWPADDLKGEARRHAERTILGRLGLPQDAAGYDLNAARQLIPESLAERITDEDLAEAAQDAHAKGYLPWQFHDAIKEACALREAQLQARTESWDKLEEGLRGVYHHRAKEMVGVLMQTADLIDRDQFGAEMVAMSDAERSERGGPLKQALTELVETMDPKHAAILARHFLVHHDLHYSEGAVPGGSHAAGKSASDPYTVYYEQCKLANPKRGHAYWDRYAQEKTGKRL